MTGDMTSQPSLRSEAGVAATNYTLEGFISTVGQHVSLQPTLTGGRRVIHLATLPQTNKHLENGHKDRGRKKIRPAVMEFRRELTFILCRLLISPENGSG